MNNEGCECVICLDNIVNKNNNCNVCNNGICNNCYVKMIERTFDITNDISYNCPFCKEENFKKWDNIDNNIIVEYFSENEYKYQIQIRKLNELLYDKEHQMAKLKKTIKNKTIVIEEQKVLIFNQNNIINNILLNLPKPDEPIKKLRYQEFYKITYKSLKESETSLLPQDAMKRISILWKEYKKSFEIMPQSLQET